MLGSYVTSGWTHCFIRWSTLNLTWLYHVERYLSCHEDESSYKITSWHDDSCSCYDIWRLSRSCSLCGVETVEYKIKMEDGPKGWNERNRRFEGGARFTLSTSRISVSCCCCRLVTNFQETNRQQETHARSVNLRLSRNLSLLSSVPLGSSKIYLGNQEHGRRNRY